MLALCFLLGTVLGVALGAAVEQRRNRNALAQLRRQCDEEREADRVAHALAGMEPHWETTARKLEDRAIDAPIASQTRDMLVEARRHRRTRGGTLATTQEDK